jgi:hypothetical protein
MNEEEHEHHPMDMGSVIIGTVDTVGHLARSVHRSPLSPRYRRLVDSVPSASIMMGMLKILEGIADSGETDLSVEELIAVGVEETRDSVTEKVMAMMNMGEIDLDAIDWE